jgi:hypothetical protein
MSYLYLTATMWNALKSPAQKLKEMQIFQLVELTAACRHEN